MCAPRGIAAPVYELRYFLSSHVWVAPAASPVDTNIYQSGWSPRSSAVQLSTLVLLTGLSWNKAIVRQAEPEQTFITLVRSSEVEATHGLKKQGRGDAD